MRKYDVFVSKDVPARSVQLVGICLCKVFLQCGESSSNYSVSKDISEQNSQSVRIYQYKIVSN
jgi:hypothetical protein